MDRFEEISDILIQLEKQGFSEFKIMDCFEEYLKANINDSELYYDINEVLYNFGYQIQFFYPDVDEKQFEPFEYEKSIFKVKQSYPKTVEFMKYLYNIDHLSFSIIGMDFILVKYLYQSKLFIKEEIEVDGNTTLMDLYFDNYEDDDVRNYIEERVFSYIGLRRLDLEYIRFHLDMEHLLYSIRKVDKSQKNYYKINTIKVALNIIDGKYVCWKGKAYYDKQIHKKILKFIDLIPKDLKAKYIKKYINLIDNYYADGYKVLFNLL